MASDDEILRLAREADVFKTGSNVSDDDLSKHMTMELDCYEYFAPQGKSMVVHWWDMLVMPPNAPYSELKTKREQKLERELAEARAREEVELLRSNMRRPQDILTTPELVEAQAGVHDADTRLEEERIAEGRVKASRYAAVGSHLRHIPYDIRAHLECRQRRLEESNE